MLVSFLPVLSSELQNQEKMMHLLLLIFSFSPTFKDKCMFKIALKHHLLGLPSSACNTVTTKPTFILAGHTFPHLLQTGLCNH